ncbi:867_t:CDS:2 [Diversispora eburnea]|uniref:867_t:CDS:1 n=1 Tax=Diversispora eburnea TaxID=1213867 RepID=A0A9N9GGV8_9GLOM|nr:867_t:CDS:2 [Diversispora eburnea]
MYSPGNLSSFCDLKLPPLIFPTPPTPSASACSSSTSSPICPTSPIRPTPIRPIPIQPDLTPRRIPLPLLPTFSCSQNPPSITSNNHHHNSELPCNSINSVDTFTTYLVTPLQNKTFLQVKEVTCEECGKVYRGKNSRSILRRHLKEKHKIEPPRGTRWDNDPNRPKNDEERRQRMLESKRRSAQKARARKKQLEQQKASNVTPLNTWTVSTPTSFTSSTSSIKSTAISSSIRSDSISFPLFINYRITSYPSSTPSISSLNINTDKHHLCNSCSSPIHYHM